MKNENKKYQKILAAPLFLTSAASVFAQPSPIGTLNYGPLTSVPVGGGMFLILLGAMLGMLAFWKLSRYGTRGNVASVALIAMGAVAFSTIGGKMIHEAYAAQLTTALSNPAGGSVEIYSGYTEYENTSGVPLVIGNIDLDSCVETGVQGAAPAHPECTTGLKLADNGGVCFTDYSECVNGDRVTERGGYFWVRADYAAPRDDHAAVCAEFGLTPTTELVTMTWDTALLGGVAADFGYTNGGVTNCCAELMSCWDGDGGGSDAAGSCGTHNFGTRFWNYGAWSGDPDERPVFTCLQP